MAAAAAGARRAGGISLGVLPGSDAGEGSANLTLALPTGLAEMRNTLIVRAARAVIAIGGGYGTLSEIAFALRLGKPVIAMRSWEIRRSGSDHADQGIRVAGSAQEAAEWALHEARRAQARG